MTDDKKAADKERDKAVLSVVTELPVTPKQGAPGHDSAEHAARRIKGVRLRLMGASYEQVAKELGYSDKSTARDVVMKALTRVESESVTELRVIENERLDIALRAIYPKVVEGDIAAVNALLRISERRSRLNGLDAPQQVTITPGTAAGLEDALADLREVVLGEVVGGDSG